VTDRRRNLLIVLVVLGLLAASAVVIASKRTQLGLDLRGGVELVYEARPTPKVPKVTPEAVDDAITTMQKRTNALGVAETEIQRSGANQITVALPDVQNLERAKEQVGTTAQLQFYDWEPNLVGRDGRVGAGNADRPFRSLYEAVQAAGKAQPKAEAVDIPPDGVESQVERRFRGDRQKILEHYDRRNDTAATKHYLFAPGEGPTRRLLEGPAPSCRQLLQEYIEKAEGKRPAPRAPPKGSECRPELRKLGAAGPPAGSTVAVVPRGIVVVKAERPEKVPARARFDQHHVLEDDSELSGADIRSPEQNFDPQTNEPIVTFEFTDQGRKAFARVTKRIAERGANIILPPGSPPTAAFQNFAIALDNEIVSRAFINFRENPEGIDGRTGAQISGIGNLQESQDLAENLRIGALPVDLQLISTTQVSATLGQQALNQGLIAAGGGLLLTLLFLVSFYRLLGVIAGGALLVYAVLLFAVVKLIPITLTLPGIAGMILTLGVAADANIVIFERIKEEARLGASIPRAIATGYAKALRTIIDANVVTLGVAFILFMLATAGVRGFALTLLVGTLISLLTAVLATSAILGLLSRRPMLRSKWALRIGSEDRSLRFDYMGASRWFFSMSGLILVAGALAIAGLGIKFGIDFESGTRITTPIERAASVNQVRGALPADMRDARIQTLEDPELGENVVQISVPQLGPDQVTEVREALDRSFGVDQADFSVNSIGPTFGAQIARTALIAIIASLILISIYIGFRFEAKFAVPVLIALTHDILITGGVYALFGREVTTATVAALLTILGYSLYDTIIVFDRIRENMPRMPRATFSQIVNRSMSEVIVRSLVTNLCTLLPVVSLMLFGGETLRDFGFALLVGVASGTYSSVFIAAPVLTHWKEREPVYRRRRRLLLEEHGGLVPAYATATIGDGDGRAAGERVARDRRRVGARGPRAPASPPARTEGPGVAAPEAGEAAEAPERPPVGARASRAAAPETATPDTRTAPPGDGGGTEPARPGDGPAAGERPQPGDGAGDQQPSKPSDRARQRRQQRRRKKHGRR
jgi:SecD/SecF fusion protein